MPDGYDGSLEFSAKLDNKQLERELLALTKKIKKTEQDIADISVNLDETKKKGALDAYVLDGEIAKLREMKDRLADLKAMSKDKNLNTSARENYAAQIPALKEEVSEQQERVRGLRTEYNKVDSAVARYTIKLSEAEKKLERQKEEAGQVVEKIREISGESRHKQNASFLERSSPIYNQLKDGINQASNFSAALESIAAATSGKLSGAFKTAGEAVGGFSTALSGGLSAAVPYLTIATSIIGILKKLHSVMTAMKDAAVEFSVGFASALKRGAAAVYQFGAAVAKNFVASLRAIGNLGDTLGKAVSGLVKMFAQLGKRFNIISQTAEALSGAFKRLGNTIKSALVFSVIYKGLSVVREQMGAYLSVNTQFATALRQLQGVLLTAFQPIYDVVVPALTTMINALTNAIAVIAQFFASLFGTTAKKAQVSAKALYDEAKALKATGKAADEATGSLAGFDEINTIQTEDKSGSGGGASTDTGPLFDYNYEETPFDTWGEAFSAFLDRLLEGIPKLREAFDRFADWLNDFTKKLYEMFTFPGVLDKVKTLGRELADALNDLVNGINWEQAGRALGAGLNLALNFLTELIYGFDWINLGRSLAAFVNGLADEIDWYEFGRLLWAGFKIGLETLAGFLVGLDMPLMAQAASSIIKGFFDEMYNTVTRIPWMGIGTQIATFLNEIDWYGTITSALTAIQAAIIGLAGMVLRFVEGLEWSGIAQQIYNAINDSLEQVDWSGIGHVIGEAFTHVVDFVKETVSGINWYEIGQNIADLILGFDFASALGSLADLIAAGINAAIQLTRGSLDTILPEVQGVAEDIASRLREAVSSVEWSELGGVIGDGIKAALTFVAGLLDPELLYGTGKAIGDFLVGLDWVEIIGGLTEVLANGIKSAVAAVTGFLESVGPHLQKIAQGIAQKINEFVEAVDWEELGRTLSDGINAAVTFLLTLLKDIDWKSIWSSAVTFINEAINNTDWEAVGDTFGEVLKAKIEGVVTFLRDIDWAGIVRAIVDFLVGVDWVSLAADVVNCLFQLIGAAVEGVIALILDIPKILEIGKQLIEGIKLGVIEAIVGIPNWLWTHLVEPIIEGVKDLFGIHSPSTVFAEIGENLIEGLKNGIMDTWKSVVDFFTQKLDELKESFSDSWDSIKDNASKTWNGIKTSLSTTWTNIKTTASTTFENVKTQISSVWEKTKSDTSQKWNTIKTNLTTTWNNVKTTASTSFDAVKSKIASAWENVRSDTSQKWNTIKSTLSSSWDSIKSTAVSKFEGIKSSISSVWSGLVSSASSWGRDMCNNIASGISGAIGTVTNAARSIADGISSFLHFSEPDVGPLSNFHTFMPDMLELMAEGIRDNTDLAVNAASDLAGSVANTLSGKSIGVNVSAMPDFSNFSIPNIAMGAVIPTNREFLSVLVDQDDGGSQWTGQEAGDEEIIALLQAILSAVKAGQTLKVDKDVLARTARDGIDDITTKTGKFALKF